MVVRFLIELKQSLILQLFRILNQSPQTDESHAFEHSRSSITATKAMLVFSPPDCPSCSHLWKIVSGWLEFTPTSLSLLSAQETALWTRPLSTFPLLLPSLFSPLNVNKLSFTLPACVSEITNSLPPPPNRNILYWIILLQCNFLLFLLHIYGRLFNYLWPSFVPL